MKNYEEKNRENSIYVEWKKNAKKQKWIRK